MKPQKWEDILAEKIIEMALSTVKRLYWCKSNSLSLVLQASLHLLTAEQNDRFTGVGPGTPMGEVMLFPMLYVFECLREDHATAQKG